MSEKRAREEACKLFKKECGTHYALRTAYVKGYAQGEDSRLKEVIKAMRDEVVQGLQDNFHLFTAHQIAFIEKKFGVIP